MWILPGLVFFFWRGVLSICLCNSFWWLWFYCCPWMLVALFHVNCSFRVHLLMFRWFLLIILLVWRPRFCWNYCKPKMLVEETVEIAVSVLETGIYKYGLSGYLLTIRCIALICCWTVFALLFDKQCCFHLFVFLFSVPDCAVGWMSYSKGSCIP